MHIAAFPPVPALADVVEYYGLWEDASAPGAPGPHPAMPGVINGISVLCGAPIKTVAFARDEKARAAPPAETQGPATRPQLYLRQTGRAGALGICFRPTGFFHLFGVPMSAATDAALEPGGAAGPFAGELVQRVGEAETGAQRLAVADELLLRQLHRCPPVVPDAVDAVARCILHRHGRVNIEALARDVGLSRRQLERRFLLAVGAPPKRYARIARFNHVISLLAESPAPDWQDIAYLCGYYDQAHFIRDFRCFTGQTPGAYAVDGNARAGFCRGPAPPLPGPFSPPSS